MRPYLSILSLYFLFSFYNESVSIKGSVSFRDGTKDFYLIQIHENDRTLQCNRDGSFTIENTILFDTLYVKSFDPYCDVKIFNVPRKKKSIMLDSIPIFRGIDSRPKNVNIGTKRKKTNQSKKLKNEKVKKLMELKRKVESHKFTFQGEEYELKLQKIKGFQYSVLIDLSRKE